MNRKASKGGEITIELKGTVSQDDMERIIFDDFLESFEQFKKISNSIDNGRKKKKKEKKKKENVEDPYLFSGYEIAMSYKYIEKTQDKYLTKLVIKGIEKQENNPKNTRMNIFQLKLRSMGEQPKYTFTILDNEGGKSETILTSSTGVKPYQFFGFQFNIYDEKLIKSISGKAFSRKSAKNDNIFKFLSLFSRILNWYSQIIFQDLERIKYISPLREEPRPYYEPVSTQPIDVGIRGQDTFSYLWHSRKASKKAIKNSINDVSKWLKKMKLANKISIEERGTGSNIYRLLIELDKKINDDIGNVGFGISQALPIITQGIATQERSILIIEQPEIHLHPRAQAEMANLFVEVAKRNRSLLIETHSEHLIRRIQRLIAQKKISQDDVALYSVTKIGGMTRIKRINMNNQGQFIGTAFPKGFFDIGYKEAMKHLKDIRKVN